jgi:hypothetical protein
MVSGTLAVTTTPQPLSIGINQSGTLHLQVTTGSPVVVGGKAGVTAGNGIQLASAAVPYPFPNSLVNLADVYVATLTATATLMWTLS